MKISRLFTPFCLMLACLLSWSAQPAFGGDTIDSASSEATTATTDANAAETAATAAAKDVNATAKGTEDKLDEALKKQDDLPDKPTEKQTKDAQDEVDKAQGNADTAKDGSANPGAVDKYRKALKERRATRKKLKAAIAKLQKFIQNNRQNGMGMSADALQPYNAVLRKAVQALKDVNSTIAMAETSKDTETYAVAVRKGEITSKLVSTGETIGIVANLDLYNNTSHEVSVTVPATVLVAQDGKSQSYAIPQEETASVPPKSDRIVPLNGVCTEAHRPPVEKGNSTGLAIADPGTPEFKKYEPQLQCTEDVIRVAKEEQKEGKFHTPFSGNPQKELDSIVQQTVWAANPAKDGAATTKEDLAKTVYKETHATTEEQKKALQPGIDQIWQAVELTGVKAKVLTPQPQT
ncbi:MAG: hypothetical protein PHD76_03860 [Methylacidiphilales bacterium]|nr:hypothetical protein [Candidatus Methylacidiphilales bacterium]